MKILTALSSRQLHVCKPAEVAFPHPILPISSHPRPGNAGELLASFTAFVKHVETKFLSRELSSLEEVTPNIVTTFFALTPLSQIRKHCISSSQSPDCEWVARANDPALAQQLLALLLDALPSLSFNSSAVAVKLDNAEASNPPLAFKSEKCEAVSLTDGPPPPPSIQRRRLLSRCHPLRLQKSAAGS